MKVLHALLFAFLGLLLIFSPIAMAQAPEETTSLVEQAEALLDGMLQKQAEYQRLETALDGLEGTDLQVAERTMVDEGFAAIDDLHALAENVLEQEAQGLDTSAFKSPLESSMEVLTSGIERTFERSVTRVEELRSEREHLSPNELVEHETLIAEETVFQDSLLLKLSELVEKESALGFGSTKNRKFMIDTLTKRAQSLSGHLDLAQEEVGTLEALLAEAPADPDLKQRALVGQVRYDAIVSSLGVTVEAMKDLGLEAAEYQQHLIQATGTLTTDILDAGVFIGLLSQWADDAKEWLVSNGGQVLFKGVIFLLILLAFRVIAGFARRVVVRGLAASNVKISKLLETMITSMVSKIVMLFGFLVALSQIGISLGPLLAGLGVAGFIVGFALQDLLSNFASGLMILFYRPFDVGDLVEAGGVFGKVSRMTLVSTTFLTLDHQTLVVPNKKIWGDVIKNVTAQKIRRVDLTFGIGYGDDIPLAEKILEAILEEHPKVLDDPEPVVKLHNLGDSSVDFVARPWVATDDYWDVYWDVTREVKMRFDREGISIPFPQHDVHLYQESPEGN